MNIATASPTVKETLDLAKRLSKAGYAAVDAQRLYAYWSQFGTNSGRERKAEERLEKCLKELEDADAELASMMERTA